MKKLRNKILSNWYRFRANVDYKIEVMQRIIVIAKIVNQNNMSKEVVDIARYYKSEGIPNAHNMLMFYDWQMKAIRTDITSGHGIVNVRFNLKGWK